MTWDDIRKTLYDALVAGWGSHPTVTIFTSKQALPDLKTRTAPFVVFKVQPETTRQLGMAGGTPPKRRFGTLKIYVYTPENMGDKQTFLPVNTLESLFSATTVSSIVFGKATFPEECTEVGWTRQGFFARFHNDQLS